MLGAVDVGRHGAEHGTRVRHDDGGERAAGRPHPFDAGGVGEHGDRAGRRRLAGEVGAVGASARQGGVEVTGEHGARVERHPGHGHLGVRVGGAHEGGEVTDRAAAELGRTGNGHVERPYRALRL